MSELDRFDELMMEYLRNVVKNSTVSLQEYERQKERLKQAKQNAMLKLHQMPDGSKIKHRFTLDPSQYRKGPLL